MNRLIAEISFGVENKITLNDSNHNKIWAEVKQHPRLIHYSLPGVLIFVVENQHLASPPCVIQVEHGTLAMEQGISYSAKKHSSSSYTVPTPACPRSLRVTCPVATSQRITVLSELHEHSWLLSYDLREQKNEVE